MVGAMKSMPLPGRFWPVWLALLLPLASARVVADHPHTGIAGRSVGPTLCNAFPPYDCTDPVPVPTLISILSEAGDLIEEVATDAEGNFAVHLKPGVYWVWPKVFTLSESGGNPGYLTPPHVCHLGASPFQVTVEKKAVTAVEVTYFSYCLD